MKCSSILGVALFASIFPASLSDAQAATECQAEIVKGRSSHWTYRLIDGRKCWYEGKTQLPKSELFWSDRKEPAAATNPPATNAQSTNAQASPSAAESEEFTDPEDGSCCWPRAKEEESFEARWRSLELKPRN